MKEFSLKNIQCILLNPYLFRKKTKIISSKPHIIIIQIIFLKDISKLVLTPIAIVTSDLKTDKSYRVLFVLCIGMCFGIIKTRVKT